MARRVDVFVRRGSSDWACYVQSVTPTNARRIAAALESEGERVGLFTRGRVIGRLIYETAPAPPADTEPVGEAGPGGRDVRCGDDVPGLSDFVPGSTDTAGSDEDGY